MQLEHLQALSLDSNNLKRLPDALVSLASLQTLNISSNQLDRLPEMLGMLPLLHTIIASHNPDLTKLPGMSMLTLASVFTVW